MRFHQPVGVIPQNVDYRNVNNSESRFLISNKANNQLTRINGNSLADITDNLNLTQLVIEKQSENTNNFDSVLDDKTTTLENILKYKADSKYFSNFLDTRQTNGSKIDLDNGNNGVDLIETINFVNENLSQVRWKFKDNCREKDFSAFTKKIFFILSEVNALKVSIKFHD